MQEISGSLSEVIRAYSDHNLLVPAATDVQLNPFYKYHVEEVAVDLSENSGDIYKVNRIPTGPTEEKLMRPHIGHRLRVQCERQTERIDQRLIKEKFALKMKKIDFVENPRIKQLGELQIRKRQKRRLRYLQESGLTIQINGEIT